MKQCRICKKIKIETQFHKNGAKRKDGTSGTRNDCKQCSSKIHNQYVDKNRSKINDYNKRRYTDSQKEVARNRNLKKYYGITIDDYNKMFENQRGVCAICENPQNDSKRKLDVDHNHETGKIRGLLCLNCNRGIGLLKDSVSILEKAISYINKNKS